MWFVSQFKEPISYNLTEIQCICKLDFGKVLWIGLYYETSFGSLTFIGSTMRMLVKKVMTRQANHLYKGTG